MSESPPQNHEPEVAENRAASGEEPDMDRDPDALQQSLGDFEVKEQDRWLPIANVARIMKTSLPDNAKIAREAKECMQECVSEFISFITSEASEKCQQEKRKTVNGEDILFAMTSLGFENYAEALKVYLTKYRESQSSRGENQNRPASSGNPSSGYGGAGSGSTATGATGQSTVFDAAGQPEPNILSPTHGLDGSDQDGAGPYGYANMVQTGHNGTGTGSY